MFQRRYHRIIPYKQVTKNFWVTVTSWSLLIILIFILIATQEPLLIFGIMFLVAVLVIHPLFKTIELEEKWQLLAKNLDLKETEDLNDYILSGMYHNHWIKITDRRIQSGRYHHIHFLQISITLKHLINAELMINQINFFDRKTSKKTENDLNRYLSYRNSTEDFFSQIIASRNIRQGLLDLGDAANNMKIKIEGQLLTYEESGRVSDIVYLKSVLSLLVEIASQVEQLEAIKLKE